MQHFKEIPPRQLEDNPFELIGSGWMLVSAQHEGAVNTMTASWGGVGVLWHRPVATIYIRPQRYTFSLLQAATHFSLCFFDESYRDLLTYCGKVSGREEDKIARCGLETMLVQNTPIFAQARLALVCKKLYTQDMDPTRFLDPTIEKHYPGRDYHRMHIGEIQKALVK